MLAKAVQGAGDGMRIIAGKHRGRRLKAVPGLKTRPTADRVKEAVFSALDGRLWDCRFLDVFGGTASIALEAVSRGAKEAVVIEKDPEALKVIRDNIAACREEHAIQVLSKDVMQALKALAEAQQHFEVIYIDPPYQAGLYEKILALIAEGELLTPDGIIICESAKNTSLMLENSLFCIYKERFYGDTKISFLQYHEETEEE